MSRTTGLRHRHFVLAPVAARNSRRTFALLLASNLTFGVVGFLTSRIAARWLSPDGRGELAAIQNIPNLLAVLGGLGLGEAALYFSAKTPMASGSIVRRALKISTPASMVMFAVSLALLPAVIRNPSTVRSAQIFAPIVLVVPLFMASHQPLRSLGRNGLWVGMRLSLALSWLVILLVGQAAGIRSPRLLAGIWMLAQGAVALVSLWLSLHYPRVEDAPVTSRDLLRYGAPSSLVALPQVLNLRLDQILLTGFVARSQLGLYATAVSWSWIVSPPFQALAQLALPRLAASTTAGGRRRMVGQVLGFAVALAILAVAIGVPLTGRLFPAWFGSGYAPGTHVAQLLVVASAISGMMVVLEETERGLGRPSRVLVAELTGLAVTVLGLALLLRRHGITGAAWASIAGYGTVVVFLVCSLMTSRREPLGSTSEASSGGQGRPSDP